MPQLDRGDPFIAVCSVAQCSQWTKIVLINFLNTLGIARQYHKIKGGAFNATCTPLGFKFLFLLSRNSP